MPYKKKVINKPTLNVNFAYKERNIVVLEEWNVLTAGPHMFSNCL